MATATVPAPSTVHLLSSSSQPLHIHTHPVTVHPPPSHPDPLSLNPKSVPNLHPPSSDPHPPPPPTPPSPTPNPSLSEAPLQPQPPLLAAPHAILPYSPALAYCASVAPPLVHVPPYPDPFPPLSLAPPLYASAAAAGIRPPPATSFTCPSSIPLLPHPPPPPSGAFPSHPPGPAATPPGLSPTPPRSFAQAARGGQGSGFVRSHAADVSSFARLPRTGVSIVCGSKEGIPSVSFVGSDLPKVEDLFSNALVMKFHGGRPSLEASHREILSWGLEHPFTIGPLSSRAFLLRFQSTTDLTRVLARPSTLLITFPYKIFRWHSLYHIKEDSCFAPVWISLPRLPLQCFIPEFLESVANKIGRFLCLDIATSTLARPSSARMCVELDLRKPLTPFIWVGLFEGFKQHISYERMPKFCNSCQAQGHLAPVCPKGQRETCPIQAEPRSEPIRERTQAVRQNATRQSSSTSDRQDASAATFHNSTTPPPPNPAIPGDITRNSAPISAAEVDGQACSSLLASMPTSPAHHVPSTMAAPPPPPQSSSAGHQPINTNSTVALFQVQQSAALSQQAPAGLEPRQSTSLVSPSGHRVAISEQVVSQPSSSHGCTPSAAPSANLDPPLQSASPVQRVSGSAAPSLLPADPSVISAHSSGLMVSTMTHPPPPHKSSTLHKGKHKSIKTKPPDGGTSSSLTQQQQEALELFKSKVLGQPWIRDHQPSVNHFEALRYDHSDADGEDASYYSDTDDGCVEPIELGYQSANGRSSNKHKDFALSGTRTNKRHPNMPLRVKLRSRKDSHPSTP